MPARSVAARSAVRTTNRSRANRYPRPSPMEMSRRLGNDHFQCGPDSAVQEMPAVSSTVAFSNHHMSMKLWVAVCFCNVPGKREDLHLFFYGDLLMALLFSIKEAKGDFAESANGGDLRSLNPFSEANRNSDFLLRHLCRIRAPMFSGRFHRRSISISYGGTELNDPRTL